MLRSELQKGARVVLVKDINVGANRILEKERKGTIEEVDQNTGYITIRIDELGVMMGTVSDVLEHFDIYKEVKEDIQVTGNWYEGLEVKNVVRQNRVTVALLNDGSFGMSECHKEDKFDEEKGRQVAILKARISSLQRQLEQY